MSSPAAAGYLLRVPRVTQRRYLRARRSLDMDTAIPLNRCKAGSASCLLRCSMSAPLVVSRDDRGTSMGGSRRFCSTFSSRPERDAGSTSLLLAPAGGAALFFLRPSHRTAATISHSGAPSTTVF